MRKAITSKECLLLRALKVASMSLRTPSQSETMAAGPRFWLLAILILYEICECMPIKCLVANEIAGAPVLSFRDT